MARVANDRRTIIDSEELHRPGPLPAVVRLRFIGGRLADRKLVSQPATTPSAALPRRFLTLLALQTWLAGRASAEAATDLAAGEQSGLLSWSPSGHGVVWVCKHCSPSKPAGSPLLLYPGHR